MRIGSESASRPATERHRAENKKSDRFAKVLKREKIARTEGEGAARAGEDPAKLSLGNAGRMALFQPVGSLSQTGGGIDGLRGSSAGATLPPELEALSSELGGRLELVKQAGAARELNITFESQAFAGLRVQLQQSAGAVNIHFISGSPEVTRLLRQHVGALRETLMQKGVRVRELKVGSAPARPASDGYKHA